MHTETQKPNLIRPGTLAQVLLFVCSGEKFRFCLAGFLDDFYREAGVASRLNRVADDPGVTDDPRMNALLGAIGEHLVSRCHGQPNPDVSWDRPWFMGPERMKGFLLAESPLAFRRRFIFTEAEPLRRASMPRDERWWAYGTIRSGLTPTAEKQAEIERATVAS
jgi:hypothetical protein